MGVGRKRKTGPRQPNGRPAEKSKALQAKENMAVAINGRQNVFGLSEEKAKQPRAETELGRLALDGLLCPRNEARNAALYLAGEFWRQTRMNAERALECRRMASGGDMERIRGYDASDGTDLGFIEKCERAIKIDNELRQFVAYGNALEKTTIPAAENWATSKFRLRRLRHETGRVKRYMDKNGIVA